MLSRRTFIASAAATAVVPVMPSLGTAGNPPARPASNPLSTMWVGGHWGEFDWQPFNARTRAEALRQLLRHHGCDDVDKVVSLPENEQEKLLNSMEISIQRVETMDGLEPEEVKPHHWVSAGLGSLCSRCDNECYGCDGGRVFGTEVVCEECTTIVDLVRGSTSDVDVAEERLVELMIDEECDEASVLEVLGRNMDVSAIPAVFWEKCLGAARAEL